MNSSNSETQRAKASEPAESPESQLQIPIEQEIVNDGTDKEESLKGASENDKNTKYPYFMYALALIQITVFGYTLVLIANLQAVFSDPFSRIRSWDHRRRL